MKNQKAKLVESAVLLARDAQCDGLFLFLNSVRNCRWFLKSPYAATENIVLVVPREVKLRDKLSGKKRVKVIRSWSGNQSRFSRIKYAYLHGVHQKIITPESRVVCVLGPWGKDHLDTIAIHDLSRSWAEDFPFDPNSIMHYESYATVLAVVDIALDIGALGREGKAIGTAFVIGDTDHVLRHSHQAVFNPVKGYPARERLITRPEVVESIKELAQLDGAFIISGNGTLMAAGRHLDARSILTKQLRGLGSRHRTAAGITRMTGAIAIVISESTGRVTIFEKGKIVSTLDPVISSRLV